MPTKKLLTGVVFASILSGCVAGTGADVAPSPQVTRALASPPPGADPAACWGRDATQSVIEDREKLVLVQPAQIELDGTVRQPPIYRNEVRPTVIVPGREIWFEVLCPAQVTPEFVGSVQRALAARGFYKGPISQRMDARTLRAVRKYQSPQGLDSSVLSLAAARKLGLVALPRDEQIDLGALIETQPAPAN
ncbi:peptidoglycan-binding domain-containing protein [Algirhabdus cladophorae]|uniref:peptidoglycan-binding domain-containing protein n=1 Tax=Algirhabdus cladophorae TaxID=3377108 RepID=UPI003B84ADAD